MISSPLTVKILILSFTCEDIDDVIVIMISANHAVRRFATQTRISSSTKMAAAFGMFGFKTVVLHYRRNYTHKRFRMERKSFKGYSEAAIVEKKKSFKDEILL